MKPLRIVPLAVTLVALLTACGETAHPAVARQATVAPAVTMEPATSTVAAFTPSTLPTTSSVTTTTISSAATITGFAVAAGAPSAVIDEQLRVYGEVLDPASFATRFGLGGLAFPDAPGVIVVEHQQLVDLYPPRGASRWDSVTYAFTDPRTAGELIDAAADAIGIDLSIGEGVTGCTEGIDPATFMPAVILCPDADGSWNMQIIRDTFVDEAPTPPAIVASHLAEHSPVADLGATLSEWNLTRSHTAPNGYTLTVTYTLANPITADDLTGLFPGWTVHADEGYGPSVTDGTNYWTLAADGPQLVYSTADLSLME